MPQPVYAEVTFTDAQEAEAKVIFRLATELDDTQSNMAAIVTEANSLHTGLAAMSAAAVGPINLIVVAEGTDPAGAPNEFAYVKNYAFVRVQDTVTLEGSHYNIPAPDMLLYEANSDGYFKDAWQIAWAAGVAPHIVTRESGNNEVYSLAQLRTKAVRANRPAV